MINRLLFFGCSVVSLSGNLGHQTTYCNYSLFVPNRRPSRRIPKVARPEFLRFLTTEITDSCFLHTNENKKTKSSYKDQSALNILTETQLSVRNQATLHIIKNILSVGLCEKATRIGGGQCSQIHRTSLYNSH